MKNIILKFDQHKYVSKPMYYDSITIIPYKCSNLLRYFTNKTHSTNSLIRRDYAPTILGSRSFPYMNKQNGPKKKTQPIKVESLISDILFLIIRLKNLNHSRNFHLH